MSAQLGGFVVDFLWICCQQHASYELIKLRRFFDECADVSSAVDLLLISCGFAASNTFPER